MDVEKVLAWIAERAGDDDVSGYSDYIKSTASSLDESKAFGESAQAKIAELDAKHAELQNLTRELKAKNYDLMISAGAVDEQETPDEEPEEIDDDEVTIDDLFEQEKDDA